MAWCDLLGSLCYLGFVLGLDSGFGGSLCFYSFSSCGPPVPYFISLRLNRSESDAASPNSNDEDSDQSVVSVNENRGDVYLVGTAHVSLKSESDQICKQELMKASERLGKVLSEADIRVLISSMVQKSGAYIAEKEGKREKNMLIKQMERHKREIEKEKKRLDLELQKEKLQSEKELKRLQDEAEKEEKRREKEESELRKQLRRQQEEAERDQRRREKEEAELKKQLTLQKQVSLRECFLKKSKNSSPSQKEPSPAKITSTDTSCNGVQRCLNQSLNQWTQLFHNMMELIQRISGSYT